MSTSYKNKQSNRKIKKTGDSRYIHRHNLYQVCFQHHLTARAVAHKMLHDKAFKKAQPKVVIKEVLL